MKSYTICFVLFVICCLFVAQTKAIFGGKDKKPADDKGKCSLYKGRCGGKISNTCCKSPYKCALQTKVCGKDKMCCVTEADIQRHKQETGGWVSQRNG